MQPLTVITGILLGTSASISFGLAVVFLISLLIGDEAPALAAELGTLAFFSATFLGMTALCAAGFLGIVKNTPWRWWAQACMWLGVAGVVWLMVPA